IEGDREEIAAGKLNPSVQSISLADGTVSTLLRGMVACDGIRTSPWGTVIATEEEDDGGVYEILDPLLIDNVVISDRATGAVSDPAHVAKRTAMAVIAWEGFVMTPEGVVYGGDELRPGTDAPDADGGALFKFIPATLYSDGMIASLDQSPLVAGTSYALQVSCQGASVQAGQGCEIGRGWWVEIDPATARASAFASHATGYYRPEDLHQDPLFAGPGIRMCGANTGNEGASNYAEVMCYIDSEPTLAPAPDADGKVTLSAEANRFVEGDPDFNSMDNLAFQPGTGILYVIEDHENGDIFACLPDGGDRDIKTDGCIKMLSVKDSSAEPTGFIFTPDGMTAYVSIQHSDDANMSPLDDYGTDDLVVITGFARPAM
ncbi:MAG: alkaline phosphatase PhoX, partial [Cucumibacter sp.]